MMRIPKPLLEEFGGGMQEFTLKDVSAISFILEDLCHFRSSSFDRKSQQLSAFEDSHPVFFLSQASSFAGIEELSEFLTSQQRQAVILYLVNSLRAEKGEAVGGLVFREAEAICKSIDRCTFTQILEKNMPGFITSF